MKKFLLPLLLLLFTSEVFAQQEESSGAFIHLTRIDKPPFSAGCSENSAACTAAVIERFILEYITAVGPLSHVKAEKIEVPVRVIINTEGNVNWASVKGLPEEAGNQLASRLKQMPSFSPGEHLGEKANVIVDLKLPLYLSEPENSPSKVVFSGQAKQQPVWKNCRKEKDPQTCTTIAINDWMNTKVRPSAIKEPGVFELTAAFVIDENGSVNRIIVLGGGDDFAPEAIKQLKKMPRLEWGEEAGEPIAVSYILPMTYRRL